jgi:AcrR family transcriptional regulator
VPTPVWRNLPPHKRDRVLEVALTEFGQMGYSRGSLNVVAREAGIAKGSLFQYFTDKLDLFAEVCHESSRRVRAGIEPRLARLRTERPDQDFAGFVVDALLEWALWFADHPVERGVTAATVLEMDGDVRKAVRDVSHRHYLEVIVPLVDDAVRRGELPPGIDRDALLAWLLLLCPHVALAPFLPELDPVLGMCGADRDRLRDAIARLARPLLAGIAVTAGTASTELQEVAT